MSTIRPGSSIYWPGPAAAYSRAVRELGEAAGWPAYVVDGALAATVLADQAWHPDPTVGTWDTVRDWIGLDAPEAPPGKPSAAGWLASVALLLAEDGEPEEAPGLLALARAVQETAQAAEAAGEAAAGRQEWIWAQISDRLDPGTPANVADVQGAAVASVTGAAEQRAAAEAELAAAFTSDPIGWVRSNPVKAAGAAGLALALIGAAINPAGAVMAVRALVRR